MILTGGEIEMERTAGRIRIEPFSIGQVNPNSYNVRLGQDLLRYTDAVLDSRMRNPTDSVVIPPEGLVLEPGEVYLGHTIEQVGSDPFVPMLYGRSSVGRLGLFVQITAPIGDIGYFGQWTLMLTPVVPVRVYSEMQIGQVMFFASRGSVTSYTGKYQFSMGPRASEMWRNFEAPGA